jgi:hypothetical protein
MIEIVWAIRPLKCLCALKDWLDTEIRDHYHSNMYDSSEYVMSNPGSSRYDSDNVSQDDNEDED